jgi:hypothetical protein
MIISRNGICFLPIFFDSSKALYAAASKLVPKAFGTQTVEAVNAPVRQELLPKNLECRSNHSCLYL